MRLLTRPAAFLLPAALAVIGCAKTSTDVGQQAQKAAATQPAALAQGDATGRVKELIAKVGALQDSANRLPGSSDAEFRQLIGQSFGDLLQVFPYLENEYQSGEYRQGIRILDTSRQQLASGSKDLAIEPTVGQGLRATVRLLNDVNNVVFNNDEQNTKRLDTLRQRVDELDAVHGPMNRVVAAQSVREAASVLQQMTASLAERTGVEMPKSAAGAAALVHE